ncbi:MAG: Glutathione hydrolase proenzyme [Steroidobacteraceae bacterium]|nr:Glutathione hydrolase proenzyme [Steroidobacteraceae bacterium]
MSGRTLRRAPRLAKCAFAAFAFVIAACLAAPLLAAERAPGHAAIASAHPLATAAGHEILAKGGNAFDAAVAVTAALAVVEPTGSGLTGGGFYLLHRASDARDVMIDAREKAPLAATRDMFLGPDGNPVPGMSLNTALGAGIAGEAAAIEHLVKEYGRLPLAVSLAPAIRLAREGFPLYTRLRANIERKREVFAKQPEVARVWLRKGEAPAPGTVIRQPQLAHTLETLAKRGMRDFYEGETARKLVAGVRKLGGIWTAEDLAAYRVVERAPIVGEYRGARIVSSSPPASGGIVLVEALNVLAGYDLAHLDAVTRTHLIIESMQRAHRDRAVWLGDPDFVTMPVAELIHPYYAAGLRASIRLDRAMPSADLPGVKPASQGDNTTHFSILDAEGNRAAVTITLNFYFGSGLSVPGTGLFLNDEMDDFSSKAGVPNGFNLVGNAANAIAPGKRMLSSSTPTFIETPRGLMIAGTPGGSYITGMVLLATLDFLDGRNAAQIVAAPRIHHQYLPDVLQYEPGALTAADTAALAKLGYQLRESKRRWGNLQVVTWDYASGRVEAASDPRGEGEGQVY